MIITLKNLKVAEFMSHETLCYTATFYVDGKKAGTVENDGQGGCTNVHFIDPAVYLEAEEWIKTLPEETYSHGGETSTYKMTLDCLIDGIATDQHNNKRETAQFKRWCKKETVFRLKGDKDGNWRTIRMPFDQRVKGHIHSKYPNCEEILNERF